MPDDLKKVPTNWVSLTLSQDETWQCLTGKVRISYDINPLTGVGALGLENGTLLEPLMALEIPAGRIVRYRRHGAAETNISRRIT